MKQFERMLRKSAITLVAAVQIAALASPGFTNLALAVESTSSEPEAAASTVECPSFTGTAEPTGSSAHTFAYNPETCLWENAYYTWSPVTKAYSPKYDDDPVLNSKTECWETTKWVYNAAATKYEKRVSRNCPVEVSPQPEPISSGSPEASTQSNVLPGGNSSGYSGGSTISNTGPNSSNGVNTANNTDIDLNNTNNASILSTLNSTATSGDAAVLNNTTGGDATSGDAQTVANMLNMLQSSWDPMYGDIKTFSASLLNDYYGDLVFNPGAITNTGPDSANTIDKDSNTNLTINNENNASITNDVNMNAVSGDATVSGNTTGGDATSGDAAAVANIVNMINSMITAGESFFGSINLYGDLDGDILLPESLLAQIMNTGPNSDNTINSSNDLDADINNTNNYSITNNADLSAASGNATVSGNTTGGNATSGDAETNINQHNLIGQNVSAKNGLMVFVNVLGSWVGFLFNAPSGTSSILGTGPDSTNSINAKNNTNADINNTNNFSITNNLDLNSRSGDASVTGNTTGGNATSGNATSSANLLNMIDSQMDFSDWFGVLFINVFGNWNGSFGTDTAAGDKPAAGNGGQGGEGPASNNASGHQAQSHGSNSSSSGTGGFSAVQGAIGRGAGFAASTGLGGGSGSEDAQPGVSSTQTEDTSPASEENNGTQQTLAATTNGGFNWFALGAVLIAFALLFGERLLAFIRPKA